MQEGIHQHPSVLAVAPPIWAKEQQRILQPNIIVPRQCMALESFADPGIRFPDLFTGVFPHQIGVEQTSNYRYFRLSYIDDIAPYYGADAILRVRAITSCDNTKDSFSKTLLSPFRVANVSILP